MAEPAIVSVVMAAYNEQDRIERAINGILSQSYTQWELIIVDDGSTDNTSKIIKRYVQSDHRICCLFNERNVGLAKSLNRGINLSNGVFIARMDADDACHEKRLELQIEFLQHNPGVAVVGCNANLFNQRFEYIGKTQMPVTPSEIQKALTKLNPLIHSSVVFRRDFFETLGGYDNRLRRKQDYDLWLRGQDNWKYANIEDTLIDYTIRPAQTFKSNCYGFYVRVLNAYRRKQLFSSGVLWAFIVFFVGLVKIIGYEQRSLRKSKM